MSKYLLLGLLFSTKVFSLSWEWTDCSTPLYVYPNKLSEHPAVIESLDEEFIRLYVKEKELERESLLKEMGERPPRKPDMPEDIDSLSKDEAKKLFLDTMTYINWRPIDTSRPVFPSIELARSHYVVTLFIKVGKEYVENKNLTAQFMSASYTNCKIDKELTEVIATHAVQKIVELGGKLPNEQG